ncbi:dual oxidase, partial [Dermacentor silvarum]|uniref:dual oxidase n=1 Tax=Dermacentor silvarum TaxID=543639 RepID=UPI00189BF8DE
MRGRDNGLPDYNTVRRHLGLPPITNWTQINEKLARTNSELFDKLRKLYRDQLDKVDLFVGGMLESDEGRPGPLFRKIIREQFERLRDADRFWFENRQNGMFSAKEIEGIRKIRMYDIILAATDIRAHEIQKNVFFHVK